MQFVSFCSQESNFRYLKGPKFEGFLVDMPLNSFERTDRVFEFKHELKYDLSVSEN